jgi:hypothetical protein
VFDQLDTKQDKKIDADEVMDFFKKCGETVKKVRRSSRQAVLCFVHMLICGT